MNTYIYLVLYVSGFSGLLGNSIKMVSSYTLGQILPHTFPEKKKDRKTDRCLLQEIFNLKYTRGAERETDTKIIYIQYKQKTAESFEYCLYVYVCKALNWMNWITNWGLISREDYFSS